MPITDLLKIAKSAIELGKSTLAHLPNSKERVQAEKELEYMEKELKVVEPNLAKELGYQLCYCTYPPQIMLYNHAIGANICSVCGNENTTKTTVSFSD